MLARLLSGAWFGTAGLLFKCSTKPYYDGIVCMLRYAGGMYLLSTDAAALLSGAVESDPRLSIVDPYPIEDHFIASYIVSKASLVFARQLLRAHVAIHGRVGAPSLLPGARAHRWLGEVRTVLLFVVVDVVIRSSLLFGRHVSCATRLPRQVAVKREPRLWWKGGAPYNAPHVEQGDYLLQRHWQGVDGSQHPDDDDDENR